MDTLQIESLKAGYICNSGSKVALRCRGSNKRWARPGLGPTQPKHTSDLQKKCGWPVFDPGMFLTQIEKILKNLRVLGGNFQDPAVAADPTLPEQQKRPNPTQVLNFWPGSIARSNPRSKYLGNIRELRSKIIGSFPSWTRIFQTLIGKKSMWQKLSALTPLKCYHV